ncbi:MAG: hypothetical protein M1835_001470 [Candelina submexicana]|nr:MAG: hypothetical protein M1835_001470 [Candelina submexicana]
MASMQPGTSSKPAKKKRQSQDPSRQFGCCHCSRRFNRRDEVKSHIKTRHQGASIDYTFREHPTANTHHFLNHIVRKYERKTPTRNTTNNVAVDSKVPSLTTTSNVRIENGCDVKGMPLESAENGNKG